jgi:hypothetical protein
MKHCLLAKKNLKAGVPRSAPWRGRVGPLQYTSSVHVVPGSVQQLLNVAGLEVVIFDQPMVIYWFTVVIAVSSPGQTKVRVRVGCAIKRHLLSGEIELSTVIKSAGHLAFGERAGKSGHGEGGEDGDDRNNDEHFD